jgi:hypothetical protein
MKSLRGEGAFVLSPKWHMNLLLAIGARYSHLIGAEWRGDERDHLLYATKAVRLLDMSNTAMVISTPDIPSVQAVRVLQLPLWN